MDSKEQAKMTTHLGQEQIAELTEVWVSLQRHAPLGTIRNDDDFARVGALADMLAKSVGDDVGHPLFSLFELTMTLIERWECEHVSLPKAEPRDVLRCLLEANDLEPSDLEDLAPSGLLGQILSGQRNIDDGLAKALSERFRISVEAFR
jgi:HTH-type transcriptional regulator/antitoxin HigA